MILAPNGNLCSFVLIQKNQKIKAALLCASAANDTRVARTRRQQGFSDSGVLITERVLFNRVYYVLALRPLGESKH